MNAKANARGWKQPRIVHISDMHFGRNHFFNPPGNGAESDGRSLLHSILRDLNKMAEESSDRITSDVAALTEPPRVIFALAGDFNERCIEPEFKKSRTFLDGPYGTTVFRGSIEPSDIFVITI
jgi:hypothetical protein